MKKFLSIILSIAMVFSVSVTAFADEPQSYYEEQLSVSAALMDPEIVNFLIQHDELDELYEAQEEIRNTQYDTTASYASESLDFPEISADDIQYLSEKYDLQLPEETVGDIIDNGTINVERNTPGKCRKSAAKILQ